ncbi:hypothetical protein ABZ863_10005 [Saccharomonospora sp. NPDC046836]|uniref:terpene synthase family protein n=1 Tax=Saccharomonospora sp. NPDC046836 TaxID=3156921 RepID=UPI0033D1E4F8
MSCETEEQLYARFAKLPRPRYPFPDLVNPHIDALARECDRWIDEDYRFNSPGARERHKRHRLTDIPARAFPQLRLAELRPVARFTSSGAMMDDYFDHSSSAEVSRARDRIMALLTGEDGAEPQDLGIYRQFYLLRQDAMGCGMPPRLYDKFIAEIDHMLIAYQAEKQWIAADQVPPLEVLLPIRENTSGGVPFAKYVCMEQDFRTLPDTVLEHPVILRLHALSGRLIGWHNDLISLPKELSRRGDVVNIVLGMRHHHDMSIEEAYVAALEFHDNDLREFMSLQEHLPYFGEWHDRAQSYVRQLGIMIQGTYMWHVTNCGRYAPGAYVEPEHDSREFQWVDR